VTGIQNEWSRNRVPLMVRAGDYSLLHSIQPCLEWILENLPSGIKWEKREAGHLPPFIA